MCGIAGIISRYNGGVESDRLIRARDVLYHRGPDGAGLYVNPECNAGLAHRRLSIIDLSSSASQPMCNEDESIWLTCNGEIYNYRELVPLLESKGHVFRSKCDSEVILHAYEEWGTDCILRFVGMFAFGIWDIRKQWLFLVRDHLGIKPLYYYWDQNEFIFASEIKAILSVKPDARKPNYDSLYDFLTISRFDHNETTFFDNIQQLKPGHYLYLMPEKWNMPNQKKYWSCSPANSVQIYDYQKPVEGFLERFKESIDLQLRSDVPLGAFLSGGLDSSSVVGVASPKIEKLLSVFSVVYDDPEYDESKWIQAVLNKFPLIRKSVTPDSNKMIDDLSRFVWFQEMPTNGPGPFSEWCVSELASSSVKVVLSGQGADEMIGGYHYFYDPYFKTRFKEILKSFGIGLSGLFSEMDVISKMTNVPKWYYLLYMTTPIPDRLIHNIKRNIRERMFTPDFQAAGDNVPVDVGLLPEGNTVLDRHLAGSVTGWGLTRLLHYLDRNSMAFSLEARVPFLDHRLVEYAMGLPYTWKINGTSTKHVLRNAMHGILPSSIINRKDKKGFETPVESWLRLKEDWVRDILSTPAITRRNIYKPKAVQRLLDDFMKKSHKKGIGRRTLSWEVWRMVQLELWFQNFIDNRIDNHS